MIGRRDFMTLAGALGVGTALGTTLLGKPVRAATPKKGGHLIIGLDGAGAGDSVDPATYTANYMQAVGMQFYNTLAEVDEKKMRANLDITKGLIVSEAVMMGLGPYLGRQYAHDLVYDICRQVVATGRPLADLLAENAEVSKHLSKAEIASLCDPANYLGQAGEMVDRVLGLRRGA